MWGGNVFLKVISPPFWRGLGGNIEVFPPHSGGVWGGNFTYFPPMTLWGGNRENFEKSDPQIIDFPLGNCISDFKIVKIFACGALVTAHQSSKFSPAAQVKNLPFGGDFRDLFPPHSGGVWGGNFCFPPILEGSGGETENRFPPTNGGEKDPCLEPIP